MVRRTLILMSDAWPCACPLGWCSIMIELGRHERVPFLPLASSMAAVPKAVPRQMVSTWLESRVEAGAGVRVRVRVGAGAGAGAGVWARVWVWGWGLVTTSGLV